MFDSLPNELTPEVVSAMYAKIAQHKAAIVTDADSGNTMAEMIIASYSELSQAFNPVTYSMLCWSFDCWQGEKK